MRTLLLVYAVCFFAMQLFAQDTKPAPKPPEPKSRPLSAEVFYHGDAIEAKASALYEKYRIAEYQAQLKLLIDERNKLVFEQCESVGIPEKEIENNCRVDFKPSEKSNVGFLQWIPREVKPPPNVEAKGTK